MQNRMHSIRLSLDVRIDWRWLLVVDSKLLLLGAKCELARRDFFSYCNLMASDFYKKDRKYLIELCAQLQEFNESDNEHVMIVNEPPR